jgi:hypothetical protein
MEPAWNYSTAVDENCTLARMPSVVACDFAISRLALGAAVSAHPLFKPAPQPAPARVSNPTHNPLLTTFTPATRNKVLLNPPTAFGKMLRSRFTVSRKSMGRRILFLSIPALAGQKYDIFRYRVRGRINVRTEMQLAARRCKRHGSKNSIPARISTYGSRIRHFSLYSEGTSKWQPSSSTT